MALAVVLLLTGSHDAFKAGLEKNAVQLFGAQPGVYDATVALGTNAGASLPFVGGGLGLIFLTLPYLVFFNLWPNWGATLYGEVKGADDFKRNLYGMASALIVTTILAVIFYLLVDKTITWDWLAKANGAYWAHRWGLTETPPPLGAIWPYPALLAMRFRLLPCPVWLAPRQTLN